MSADQGRRARAVPGSRWTLVAPAPGGPPMPRAGIAGRLQPELPRRGAVEQPAGQHAAVDQLGARAVGDALAVERLGAQAAAAMRIVDDGDRRMRTHASSSRPSRKLVLRAIAGPVIAPSRWPIRLPPTRGSNTTGIAPLGELGRIEPLHRALAGAPADRLGARRDRRRWRVEWLRIIALHRRRRCRRSRSPSRHSRWSYSRARSPGWWRAR